MSQFDCLIGLGLLLIAGFVYTIAVIDCVSEINLLPSNNNWRGAASCDINIIYCFVDERSAFTVYLFNCF